MTDPKKDTPPDTSRSITSERRPRKRAVKGAPIAAPSPPADDAEDAPRQGTKARRFWEYAQAYARGMRRASGQRVTPPAVIGPQDILVRFLREHCRDEQDKRLQGDAVLTWLENAAYTFRSTADENDVRYKGGWTPRGLARWYDEKCPTKRSASPGHEHITVGSMPSGWD